LSAQPPPRGAADAIEMILGGSTMKFCWQSRVRLGLLAIAATIVAGVGAARAEDALKLAVGAPNNWENQPASLGQQAGIFKKHGLSLDILFTQGSGETMQAVIAGSADIGTGVGTYGAMGAFAKGAPVRAIGNATTGADDLYWYVRADSSIRSIKDAAGKSIAYSTAGSSTNVIVLALMKDFDVPLRPTATGSPANTFTAVMSGQIDIGWSSPPLGVEALVDGKIRLLTRGSAVKSLRDQTVRVLIANADALVQKKDAIKRFMQAYAETLDWMYADDKALQAYAEFVKVPVAIARRARDEFYPKANLRPDRLSGVEQAMADAISLKFLGAPLRKEQLDQFFQYQLPPVP
jgi:NitT/TauT family transport system substrate-binding protein